MSACRSARTDSELDGRFIGVWGYMIMRGLRGSSQDVLSATQHRCMLAPCTAVRLALHVTSIMHGNRRTNEDAQMHSLIATQPRPIPDHLELSEVSTGVDRIFGSMFYRSDMN
jgi:hypothetical protein